MGNLSAIHANAAANTGTGSGAGTGAGTGSGTTGTGSVLKMTRNTVRNLLEAANSYRRPGVKGGLFRMEDLGTLNPSLDDLEVPTMVLRTHRRERRWDRAKSDADFAARLHAVAPELGAIDWGSMGLVLAGGSVSGLLMTAPTNIGHGVFDDFDFFLVGHANDLERKRAISAFADALAAHDCNMTVTRTTTSVTFGCLGRKYQVVTRTYATLAEVVHGFDNGACAFAFDGRSVSMSAPGVLAAERMCMVLCLQGRRATYEWRLTKYMQRGYALILPDLDLKAFWGQPQSFLRDPLSVRLPYLEVGLECRFSFDYNKLVPDVDSGQWVIPLSWVSLGPLTWRRTQTASDVAMYEDGLLSPWTVNPLDIEDRYALQNLKAMLSEPPRLSALVGARRYIAGMDLAAITAEVCSPITRLLNELGRDHRVTVSFSSRLLKGFNPTLTSKVVTDDLAMRLRQLQRDHGCYQGVHIPYQFRTVDDGTLITLEGAPNSVSAEAWYGPFFHFERFLLTTRALHDVTSESEPAVSVPVPVPVSVPLSPPLPITVELTVGSTTETRLTEGPIEVPVEVCVPGLTPGPIHPDPDAAEDHDVEPPSKKIRIVAWPLEEGQ
jgi:hypothetical protein